MTITSEDAVNSMISDEIESEFATDAIASGRTIVVPVDDENATPKQPGSPDEGDTPCDEPSDAPPSEEPGTDEPDSDRE
ncbi:MAG: hypothetical protein WBY44_20870 [Bryobacteraceae bacterium]|jgi:hypothetical protein